MPKKKITPKPWGIHKVHGKTHIGPIHIVGNVKDGDAELIQIAPEMLDIIKEIKSRLDMVLDNLAPDAAEYSLASEMYGVLLPIWEKIQELEE